jgi:hypothetical protein
MNSPVRFACDQRASDITHRAFSVPIMNTSSQRILPFLVLAALPLSAAEKLEFNRDVRPILSDKCFHCHGADASHRKGDLRLDIRAEALKPAESGEIAIVPGKPERSEVVKRVELGHDDDDVMPPEKSGKPLTSAEKTILRQWIAEGAEYQGHWAFTPIKDEGGKMKDENGKPIAGSAVIDHLIRQRLSKEGLTPSPEATPATLIRRVALDLTGLPLASLRRAHGDAVARLSLAMQTATASRPTAAAACGPGATG